MTTEETKQVREAVTLAARFIAQVQAPIGSQQAQIGAAVLASLAKADAVLAPKEPPKP